LNNDFFAAAHSGRFWPISAAPTANCHGSFWGNSGHARATVARHLMTHSDTLQPSIDAVRKIHSP
jgi:hypothetical protein